MVLKTASAVGSWHQAAEQKYREQRFRGGYTGARMLEDLRRVRPEQVREAIREFVLPAVEPGTGKLVAVVAGWEGGGGL